jgi:uncharacterized protein (DUF736 family)
MSEKTDWNKLEIGALWKKTGKTESFYSGKIKINGKDQEIVCFVNKHKSAENHPDIRIYTKPE